MSYGILVIWLISYAQGRMFSNVHGRTLPCHTAHGGACARARMAACYCGLTMLAAVHIMLAAGARACAPVYGGDPSARSGERLELDDLGVELGGLCSYGPI